MTIAEQVDRLIEAGVAGRAGLEAAQLAALAEHLSDEPGAVIAVHPTLLPARELATLLHRDQKPGFVVSDMIDLEQFDPISGIEIPDRPLYLLHDVDRGDNMRNWSPNEALPAITQIGRTPLTINEGISWLLQAPHMLEPNHCFMTIGSRKVKGNQLDTRTPAIWISGGTGRDGASNKNAPKIGWCWAVSSTGTCLTVWKIGCGAADPQAVRRSCSSAMISSYREQPRLTPVSRCLGHAGGTAPAGSGELSSRAGRRCVASQPLRTRR